jgi:hypothetical protein
MCPHQVPEDSPGLRGKRFHIPESNFLYPGKYWMNFYSAKKLVGTLQTACVLSLVISCATAVGKKLINS